MNIGRAYWALCSRDLSELFPGCEQPIKDRNTCAIIPRAWGGRLLPELPHHLAEWDADVKPLMVLAGASMTGWLRYASTADNVISLYRLAVNRQPDEAEYLAELRRVRDSIFGPDDAPVPAFAAN